MNIPIEEAPRPAVAPAPVRPKLTLLVLTSFFAESRHALQYAVGLAAHLRARVVLLHVNQLALLNDEVPLAPPPQTTRELRQALQALAAELKVPADLELAPNLLPTTVADMARRYGPALFVLGRPDAKRFDFDLGSSVLHVLRHAELPVLLVPEGYSGPAVPTHLAVAADDEPFALRRGARAAVQLLQQLAPARTTVINASSMQDDEGCAAALHHVRASGLLPVGGAPVAVAGFYALHPAEGVLQGVASTQADGLLVLARHHTLLGDLFHRSVTSQVLLHSPVPVLVVPIAEME